MSQHSQVILLCEDQSQQSFARQFLRRRGVESRRIRFIPLPAGSGAGEKYVRDNYAKEVVAHRKQASYLSTIVLLVFLDADTGTVGNRDAQLANELSNAGFPSRGPVERIVHLLPKRNVETWVHSLLGGVANETTDYKANPDGPKTLDQCRDSGAEFHVYCGVNAPMATSPASLQAARTEIRNRIP